MLGRFGDPVVVQGIEGQQRVGLLVEPVTLPGVFRRKDAHVREDRRGLGRPPQTQQGLRVQQIQVEVVREAPAGPTRCRFGRLPAAAILLVPNQRHVQQAVGGVQRHGPLEVPGRVLPIQLTGQMGPSDV